MKEHVVFLWSIYLWCVTIGREWQFHESIQFVESNPNSNPNPNPNLILTTNSNPNPNL